MRDLASILGARGLLWTKPCSDCLGVDARKRYMCRDDEISGPPGLCSVAFLLDTVVKSV
jgi:hypothetical protein